MTESYQVIWDQQARESLMCQIKYIRTHSTQAAERVKGDLLALIQSLNTLPERFAKEHQLAHIKTPIFRSVSMHQLKVIYYVVGSQVRIIDVVHTSRGASYYENFEG